MGDPLGHALHLIPVLRLIHRGREVDFGDGKHPHRAILQLDLSGKGIVLRRKGGPSQTTSRSAVVTRALAGFDSAESSCPDGRITTIPSSAVYARFFSGQR